MEPPTSPVRSANWDARSSPFENDAGNLERRVKTAIGPLSSEMGELGALVKNLAETVAAQEARIATLASARARRRWPSRSLPACKRGRRCRTEAREREADGRRQSRSHPGLDPESGPFKGKSSEEIVAIIREAVDANRIDLYHAADPDLAAAQGALLRIDDAAAHAGRHAHPAGGFPQALPKPPA